MATKKKLLQAAAGSAGGETLDVDEVFSTYLYDGNSSTQTITNGIDLSGEGGLVWISTRNNAGGGEKVLVDTARGATKRLRSYSTDAEATDSTGLTAFNSNGFSLGNDSGYNYSTGDYVSWTFRKAPKFFDVVTYTGNGVAGRTISHNLDNLVGMLIIKCTSHSSDWSVQHRMLNPDKYLALNETTSAQTDTARFHNTAASSSSFTVGSGNAVNGSGRTYVAYLFAHHNSGNPGEFGPDSDQDVIKCGSYTGNETNPNSINLGFEPQWLMVKAASKSQNWFIVDVMRGITTGGDEALLSPNLSSAESDNNYFSVTPTGFNVENSGTFINETGQTYIYMAIRRGPLAEPTSATDVFATGVVQSNTRKTLTNPLGHPSDWAFLQTTSGGNWIVQSRLTESADLKFNSNAAEVDNKGYGFANNTNYEADGTASIGAYGWNFRRAPSYFDVATYEGNSQTSAITVNHNLGVVPEMMWCKKRGATGDWMVYHKDLNGGTNPHTYRLRVNSSGAEGAGSGVWNAAPTATQFSVGTDGDVNSGDNFIVYLFASLAGISKVGSYTGNGSATGPIVDCGFSSGARFVLIKRIDADGDWCVYDTERGITAGDDKTLKLNRDTSETTGQVLNPHSSGFQLATADSFANASSGSYIFYAVA